MGKLASVSYKINLVQLMETPRIAVCFEIPVYFEISEKYFCSVPLQLCSGREPWGCPSSSFSASPGLGLWGPVNFPQVFCRLHTKREPSIATDGL